MLITNCLLMLKSCFAAYMISRESDWPAPGGQSSLFNLNIISSSAMRDFPRLLSIVRLEDTIFLYNCK